MSVVFEQAEERRAALAGRAKACLPQWKKRHKLFTGKERLSREGKSAKYEEIPADGCYFSFTTSSAAPVHIHQSPTMCRQYTQWRLWRCTDTGLPLGADNLATAVQPVDIWLWLRQHVRKATISGIENRYQVHAEETTVNMAMYGCLPSMLLHLIITIILQVRYYCHHLTGGEAISRKKNNLASGTSLIKQEPGFGFRTESKVHVLSSGLDCLSSWSLPIPFPALLSLNLSSSAHDQQSKCLLKNNCTLLRDLYHYSKCVRKKHTFSLTLRWVFIYHDQRPPVL